MSHADTDATALKSQNGNVAHPALSRRPTFKLNTSVRTDTTRPAPSLVVPTPTTQASSFNGDEKSKPQPKPTVDTKPCKDAACLRYVEGSEDYCSPACREDDEASARFWKEEWHTPRPSGDAGAEAEAKATSLSELGSEVTSASKDTDTAGSKRPGPDQTLESEARDDSPTLGRKEYRQ